MSENARTESPISRRDQIGNERHIKVIMKVL